MKKIVIIFFLLTSVINAQYTIKGTITSPKNNWIILQRVEGANIKYVNNTTMKVKTLSVGGVKKNTATFEFTIPKNSKEGIYRVTYDNRGEGYVDFIFNKENIEMVFNTENPYDSLKFKESSENKMYKEYQVALQKTQKKVDSIQINSFFNPKSKVSEKAYQKALQVAENTQKFYDKKSEGMLANHFIRASKVHNIKTLTDQQTYHDFIKSTFFKSINFKSEVLNNSSIIVDKIYDYVFELEVSENLKTQQQLYKKSIRDVMKLVADDNLKTRELTTYLIAEFSEVKNAEIVDWLFSEYYDTLPKQLKIINYKEVKLAELRVAVGRTAPDFSWKEQGKEFKLSTLNDGENYLLIFWSSTCSHCVREIPIVYEFMKEYKNVSVIAFAIENDDSNFKNWSENKLKRWHNALGTHPEYKFENKTVKDYLISATPTYFVLDKNKKIIAVPDHSEDVKSYFENEVK